MASTAHTDPEMMLERRDGPEVLAEKVARLAEMVRGSRHFVTFTGAGISTSAGIPDFRGPQGKWTREAQGLPPLQGVSVVSALPTATHMALVELQRRGVLKYLISQNCDGLHRRSGLPAAAISELHGNGNLEICEECGERYFRDFRCDRLGRSRDHFTGRLCHCGGRLLNSTIDFGQDLEPEPLRRAQEHSRRADLHLTLGSSLTVSPANGCPAATAKRVPGSLVICNLQKTPLTELAAFQIYAETDTVMGLLMEQLGVPIPPFRLRRRVVVGLGAPGGCTPDDVYVRAVDPDDATLEIGILRAVDWDGSGVGRAAGQNTQALVAAKHGAHRRSHAGLDLSRLRPTLHFVGNYREPAFQLPAARLSAEAPAVDYRLSFDPDQLQWTCDSQLPLAGGADAAALQRGARDCSHGVSHREYCVEGVLKAKNGRTRQEAEEVVARRARESKEQARLDLELGRLGVQKPTAAAAIRIAASGGPAAVEELVDRAARAARAARSKEEDAAARVEARQAARAAAARLASAARAAAATKGTKAAR